MTKKSGGSESFRPWLAEKLCREIAAVVDWKSKLLQGVDQRPEIEATGRFSDDGSSFRNIVSQDTWMDNVQLMQVLPHGEPIKALLSDGYHYIEARLSAEAVAVIETGCRSKLSPSTAPMILRLKMYTIVSTSWGLDRVRLDVESVGFKGRLSSTFGDPISIEEDGNIINEIEKIDRFRLQQLPDGHSPNHDEYHNESDPEANTVDNGSELMMGVQASASTPTHLQHEVELSKTRKEIGPQSKSKSNPLANSRSGFKQPLMLESDGLETLDQPVNPIPATTNVPRPVTDPTSSPLTWLNGDPTLIPMGLGNPKSLSDTKSPLPVLTGSPEVISETPAKSGRPFKPLERNSEYEAETRKIFSKNNAGNSTVIIELPQLETRHAQDNPALGHPAHRQGHINVSAKKKNTRQQTGDSSDVTHTPSDYNSDEESHNLTKNRAISPAKEILVGTASKRHLPKFNIGYGMEDIPAVQEDLLHNASSWFSPSPTSRIAQLNVPTYLLTAWNDEAASDLSRGNLNRRSPSASQHEADIGDCMSDTGTISSSDPSDGEIPASQWPGTPSQRSSYLPPDSSPVVTTANGQSASDDLEVAAPRILPIHKSPQPRRIKSATSTISVSQLKPQSDMLTLTNHPSDGLMGTGTQQGMMPSESQIESPLPTRSSSGQKRQPPLAVQSQSEPLVNPTHNDGYELPLQARISTPPSSYEQLAKAPADHTRLLTDSLSSVRYPSQNSTQQRTREPIATTRRMSPSTTEKPEHQNPLKENEQPQTKTHRQMRREYLAAWSNRKNWLKETYVPDTIGELSFSMIAVAYRKSNMHDNLASDDDLFDAAENAFKQYRLDPESRFRLLKGLSSLTISEHEERKSESTSRTILKDSSPNASMRLNVLSTDMRLAGGRDDVNLPLPNKTMNSSIPWESTRSPPMLPDRMIPPAGSSNDFSAASPHSKGMVLTSLHNNVPPTAQAHTAPSRPSAIITRGNSTHSTINQRQPGLHPPKRDHPYSEGSERPIRQTNTPRSSHPRLPPSHTHEIRCTSHQRDQQSETPMQEFCRRWLAIEPGNAFIANAEICKRAYAPHTPPQAVSALPLKRPKGVSILSWTP